MPNLRKIVRSVRHAPVLEQMDFLWNAMRRPYYALARRRGGVSLALGGHSVIVPTEFADQGWESYETAAMHAFALWLVGHPACVVVDVGCSVGLYTHVALQISSQSRAVAIDANIASLRAVRRLTGPKAARRLKLICGFIGETPSTTRDLNDAERDTGVQLRTHDGASEGVYQLLGSTDAIATYALDTLLAVYVDAPVQPLLIKMDIEGAELAALRGAPNLLARQGVTLLLSVHPVHLSQQFDHSPSMVRELLESHGFHIELLGIDHEEHWWCYR